jgi:hypothetical protein
MGKLKQRSGWGNRTPVRIFKVLLIISALEVSLKKNQIRLPRPIRRIRRRARRTPWIGCSVTVSPRWTPRDAPGCRAYRLLARDGTCESRVPHSPVVPGQTVILHTTGMKKTAGTRARGVRSKTILDYFAPNVPTPTPLRAPGVTVVLLLAALPVVRGVHRGGAGLLHARDGACGNTHVEKVSRGRLFLHASALVFGITFTPKRQLALYGCVRSPSLFNTPLHSSLIDSRLPSSPCPCR